MTINENKKCNPGKILTGPLNPILKSFKSLPQLKKNNNSYNKKETLKRWIYINIPNLDISKNK